MASSTSNYDSYHRSLFISYATNSQQLIQTKVIVINKKYKMENKTIRHMAANMLRNIDE
jgi:hypothetical protein